MIATANTMNPASTARYGLYSLTRKSDTASPIAVVRIFTVQNQGFTSGTLEKPSLRFPGAVLP